MARAEDRWRRRGYGRWYDERGRPAGPARWERRSRTQGRRGAYGRRAWGREREYGPLYDEEFGSRPPPEMGMRDLTERYGRYSGGAPDSYEYSERTVEHLRHPRGPAGFSRTLERRGRRDRRSAPRPFAEERRREDRWLQRGEPRQRRRPRGGEPPGFRYW